MLDQIEFEKSCLSNSEIQHKKDVVSAAKTKAGEIDGDVETVSTQTVQDLEDIWKAERSQFTPAPLTTPADASNDVTSLNRKLEDTLVLMIEQEFGKDKFFVLPQGKREDGETLRQTAERTLAATCGKDLNVRFYGNAPCAFFKFKYPATSGTDAVGAKVFFFRTAHQAGNANQKLTKFEWLDTTAVLERLKDKANYVRSVKPILL